MTRHGNAQARKLLRAVKHLQLQLPAVVDESPLPECVGGCSKAWHVVSVHGWCDQCGHSHVLEAMTQCVTISRDRLSVLDTLLSMLQSMCGKLREGGTETETANGGGESVDDPRTNDDMQRMYGGEDA